MYADAYMHACILSILEGGKSSASANIIPQELRDKSCPNLWKHLQLTIPGKAISNTK